MFKVYSLRFKVSFVAFAFEPLNEFGEAVERELENNPLADRVHLAEVELLHSGTGTVVFGQLFGREFVDIAVIAIATAFL